MKLIPGSAHIGTTKMTRGAKTYRCHLLRQSYREGGKVKKRTLMNLSKVSPDLRERIRLAVEGKGVQVELEKLGLGRMLPAGDVDAALSMARKLGLEGLLKSRRCRERDLVLAMVVLLATGSGGSKRSMRKRLSGDKRTTVVGDRLKLGEVGPNEHYEALDWLAAAQDRIEGKLAKRRIPDGTLLLYDATRTWFVGNKCELAQGGYSPDLKKDALVVVIGLVCTREGEPVSVQVYPGKTHDSKTLADQVAKAKKRFGLRKVAFVGDRGTVTDAGIDSVLAGEADWITALRRPRVSRLVRHARKQGSLFGDRGIAEITGHPDYPGERLVACVNTAQRDHDRKTRERRLQAAERDLGKVAAATNRASRPLRGEANIAARVERVRVRHKLVKKHFAVEISEDRMSFRRNTKSIAEAAVADGVYVIRTSLGNKDLDAAEVVTSYKMLAVVERAFRSMKAPTLGLRPVRHWLDDRVRGHVFLCMLAYWLQWHLRRAWKPLLFDDEDPHGPGSERHSPVDNAKPSQKALDKKAKLKNDSGFDVMSLSDLLNDLATRAQSGITVNDQLVLVNRVSEPSALQAEAERLVEDYQVP